MGKIQAEIKTSFGKIIIEGSSANDLFDTLRGLPANFVNELETMISSNMLSFRKTEFDGIVKFTDEGPVLVSRSRLTHYEAIGLTLYFSDNRTNTASRINRLLEYSGIKLQVSSRLNEMTNGGLIFKPDTAGSEWKLSPKGESWIEEKVLPRLKPS